MTHVPEIALSTEDVVAVGGFFRDVADAPERSAACLRDPEGRLAALAQA